MSAMHLSELLADMGAALPPGFDPLVQGLSADSRELEAGSVFLALSGASGHGLQFINGAQVDALSAVVFDPPAPDGVMLPRNAVAVDGLRSKLGRLGDRFYRSPSTALQLTGVTGTNGKTSTVQLIAQALTLSGQSAGTIGTLGAGLYGRHVAGERTTPDVIAVHRLLATMRDQGATHVAMEVSSHALEQGRVDDVAFRIGVFTNLTRDHLDYHGTMEAYGDAKAKLLRWPTLHSVVINLDDAYGRQLHEAVAPGVRRIGVSSRGAPDARLRAERCTLSGQGLKFHLVEGEQQLAVASALLGRFNIDNLLAVAGTLRALDWSLHDIAEVLPRLSPVGGRMSRIGGEAGQALVVVDYAHTPDALEQALSSLREHTVGRLTCVFGCGGDRDRGKRQQMAAIAERGADRVIVTDDNPRSESGDSIVADIISGFKNRQQVTVQRDRAAAIEAALRQAAAGDVILIAGKGHETYQEIAGVKYPFDDLAVARRALEARS